MRLHEHTTEKGFTIVEVLVALTIFSIAVGGIITVASQGGIELVRGIRDTSVAAQPVGSESLGWAPFASAIASCSSGCDVDSTNTSGTFAFPDVSNVTACAGAGGFCPLYYDTSTGFYRDSWPAGTPPNSTYARKIVVTTTADTATVTTTVTWLEGSVTQSLTETETLFNWY